MVAGLLLAAGLAISFAADLAVHVGFLAGLAISLLAGLAGLAATLLGLALSLLADLAGLAATLLGLALSLLAGLASAAQASALPGIVSLSESRSIACLRASASRSCRLR